MGNAIASGLLLPHRLLLIVTDVHYPRPNENGKTTSIGRAGDPRSALGSSFNIELEGREPTEQEVNGLSGDEGRSITTTDTLEAFEKGEEVRTRASSVVNPCSSEVLPSGCIRGV